jgi:hypothetical protein
MLKMSLAWHMRYEERPKKEFIKHKREDYSFRFQSLPAGHTRALHSLSLHLGANAFSLMMSIVHAHVTFDSLSSLARMAMCSLESSSI